MMATCTPFPVAVAASALLFFTALSSVLAADSLKDLRTTFPLAARNADYRSNLYKLQSKFAANGQEDSPIPPPSQDNSTYANINEIRTKHLHLRLLVDFDTKSFVGAVVHDMAVLDNDVGIAQFDIWDIVVKSASVIDGGDKTSLEFEILDPNPALGSVLVITLNRNYNAGERVQIEIEYSTQKDGMAFSWLEPTQTAGKVYPYVFTECEDISCRSVAPLQDTPAIKITYSANITAPSPLKSRMSANVTSISPIDPTIAATLPSSSVGSEWSTTTLECTVPIPSYLIAFAIGNTQYSSLGTTKRGTPVGVIAEPEQMDAVVWELADLATLLEAVEEYVGVPYVWGAYSILVMPPSFPMGGMENPLITFASPTIITGDKSQLDVTYHEMAHSWTGNMITCVDWESFWLNEGFTTFIERRVSANIHGPSFRDMQGQLGNNSMWTYMVGYGIENTYSSLHPVLRGDNPDNSFSEIPYEKGFQLLYYMESLVGYEVFKNFMAYYIEKESYKSINTDEMIATWDYFVENMIPDLTAEEVNELLSAMDWTAWIDEPGLPPVQLNFTTTEAVEAQSLALTYIALRGKASPDSYNDYNSWDSLMKQIFHDTLEQNYQQVTSNVIARIDSDLSLTESEFDPEVRMRWFPMCLGRNYGPAYEPAESWMSSIGRGKYVYPVYNSLQFSGQNDVGEEWYNLNKDFYHPQVAAGVRDILDSDPSEFSYLFNVDEGLPPVPNKDTTSAARAFPISILLHSSAFAPFAVTIALCAWSLVEI